MQKWLSFLWGNKQDGRSTLPSVHDIKDLKGKRVLLRSSLNAPVSNGAVTETFRLESSVPTINFLKQAGAKVIVLGHIGREKDESLKPVFEALKGMTEIGWGGDFNSVSSQIDELEEGQAILLENIRQDERETKGDDSLAKELSDLADVYVNDAFSDSHRSHASITGVPKYLPSYFGDSFIREYDELKKVMTPEHPSLFILGGAKFETKMPLVKRYAEVYDKVYIAGALANDFFKAKGFEVGHSMVSEIDLSCDPILQNPKIMTPTDVVASSDNGDRQVLPNEVTAEEVIMDIGPNSLKNLKEEVMSAKTVLWNGPLGNFEKGFSAGTEALAKAIANSSAHSVVGGGDTIASIRALNLNNQFGFISTAGGAMLVFLETGTLPAIDAILHK